MLRLDLEPAGVVYRGEGTDGPLFADFHSLRHSFIALLDRSGATLKEAMQLARHSDPKLTMAVYGRAALQELGQAVGRLPMLTGSGSESNEDRQAPVCTGFAQPIEGGCRTKRAEGPEEGAEGRGDEEHNPLYHRGLRG
jgi:hypothetical protein